MRYANKIKRGLNKFLVAVLCGFVLTGCAVAATAETQEIAKKNSFAESSKTSRRSSETESRPTSTNETDKEELAAKVNKLQRERRLDSLRDQITTKEERAQAYQNRLLQIAEKEALIVNRLTVLEFQLQPENIERMLAGIGSTKPEDLREAVRQGFLSEQHGLQTQLELLNQERNRVQASLVTADETIERLRTELAEATLAELM